MQDDGVGASSAMTVSPRGLVVRDSAGAGRGRGRAAAGLLRAGLLAQELLDPRGRQAALGPRVWGLLGPPGQGYADFSQYLRFDHGGHFPLEGKHGSKKHTGSSRRVCKLFGACGLSY